MTDWYVNEQFDLGEQAKDARVHSVMVEVNRSLYMNEATGERSAGFDEVRRKIRSYLEAITASVAALDAV